MGRPRRRDASFIIRWHADQQISPATGPAGFRRAGPSAHPVLPRLWPTAGVRPRAGNPGYGTAPGLWPRLWHITGVSPWVSPGRVTPAMCHHRGNTQAPARQTTGHTRDRARLCPIMSHHGEPAPSHAAAELRVSQVGTAQGVRAGVFCCHSIVLPVADHLREEPRKLAAVSAASPVGDVHNLPGSGVAE